MNGLWDWFICSVLNLGPCGFVWPLLERQRWATEGPVSQSVACNVSVGSPACNPERERERTRHRCPSLLLLHPLHTIGELRNRRVLQSLRRRLRAVWKRRREHDFKVRGCWMEIKGWRCFCAKKKKITPVTWSHFRVYVVKVRRCVGAVLRWTVRFGCQRGSQLCQLDKNADGKREVAPFATAGRPPRTHTHSKAANRLWLGIQNTHGNDCGHRVSSVRKCSLKARLCVCAVCVRCVSVCVPERNSRWPLMAGVYAAKRRCTAV